MKDDTVSEAEQSEAEQPEAGQSEGDQVAAALDDTSETVPEEGDSETTEVSEITDINEIDLTEAQDAPEEIRRAIEALILVADTPVPVSLLAQLTEISLATVVKVCAELAAEYEADNRGFVLVNVAGGYRFQTHTDLAPYIERFALEGQSSRLSAAALETLAIIAYKQPLSRAQVAAIRGVNADAVMRTLQQRGYIDEIAREDGQGLAVLFQTTDMFLERIGLSAIDELPALGDFSPGSDVVEALEQSLSAEPIDEELAPTTEPTAVAVPVTTQESDQADQSDQAEQTDQSDDTETRLDAVVIDLRDSTRSDKN